MHPTVHSECVCTFARTCTPSCALNLGSRLCLRKSWRVGIGEGDSGAVAMQVEPRPDWGSGEKV